MLRNNQSASNSSSENIPFPLNQEIDTWLKNIGFNQKEKKDITITSRIHDKEKNKADTQPSKLIQFNMKSKKCSKFIKILKNSNIEYSEVNINGKTCVQVSLDKIISLIKTSKEAINPNSLADKSASEISLSSATKDTKENLKNNIKEVQHKEAVIQAVMDEENATFYLKTTIDPKTYDNVESYLQEVLKNNPDDIKQVKEAYIEYDNTIFYANIADKSDEKPVYSRIDIVNKEPTLMAADVLKVRQTEQQDLIVYWRKGDGVASKLIKKEEISDEFKQKINSAKPYNFSEELKNNPDLKEDTSIISTIKSNNKNENDDDKKFINSFAVTFHCHQNEWSRKINTVTKNSFEENKLYKLNADVMKKIGQDDPNTRFSLGVPVIQGPINKSIETKLIELMIKSHLRRELTAKNIEKTNDDFKITLKKGMEPFSLKAILPGVNWTHLSIDQQYHDKYLTSLVNLDDITFAPHLPERKKLPANTMLGLMEVVNGIDVRLKNKLNKTTSTKEKSEIQTRLNLLPSQKLAVNIYTGNFAYPANKMMRGELSDNQLRADNLLFFLTTIGIGITTIDKIAKPLADNEYTVRQESNGTKDELLSLYEKNEVRPATGFISGSTKKSQYTQIYNDDFHQESYLICKEGQSADVVDFSQNPEENERLSVPMQMQILHQMKVSNENIFVVKNVNSPQQSDAFKSQINDSIAGILQHQLIIDMNKMKEDYLTKKNNSFFKWNKNKIEEKIKKLMITIKDMIDPDTIIRHLEKAYLTEEKNHCASLIGIFKKNNADTFVQKINKNEESLHFPRLLAKMLQTCYEHNPNYGSNCKDRINRINTTQYSTKEAKEIDKSSEHVKHCKS